MIRLNDAGKNYLREKLLHHGHPVVIDNLDESFGNWIWQCNWLKTQSSPNKDCYLELTAKNTNNGRPYLIRLHDEFFDFETLKRRAKRRACGMPERRPVMTQPERVAVMLPAALMDEVWSEAKRRKLPVSVLLREVISAHFKR